MQCPADLFTGYEPILPRVVPVRRRGGLSWSMVIPGRPTSKGNSQRKFKHKILPSVAATQAAEAAAWHVVSKRPPRLLGGHLYVEAEFRREIPKTGPNSARQPGEYCLIKPDRGNTLKLIEDVMGGDKARGKAPLVYEDDAVIVEGPPRKVWWPRDETLVVVTEIEPLPITAATALRLLTGQMATNQAKE